MSLQGLISGSECAVPFNPLSQVLKHAEGDRSLQQDRVAGPSSAQIRHLPSTSSSAPGSERDIALARQFFEGNARSSNAAPTFAIPQHLSYVNSMRKEMNGHADPNLHQLWTHAQSEERQFMHEQSLRSELSAQSSRSDWANEYKFHPHVSTDSSSTQHSTFSQSDFRQMSLMSPGIYGGSMPVNMYSQSFNVASGIPQTIVNGKGKSREIDFDAAFAQAAASLQTESASIVEVDESVADLTSTLENTKLHSEEKPEYGTDFTKVWDNLLQSELPPPEEDIKKWEAEFQQLMSGQRDDYELDYGIGMQRAWENGMGDFTTTEPAHETLKIGDDGLPLLGDYAFESNNKYLDPSSARSSLQQAKDLLAQNGLLSEAILLLEAAVQKGELGAGGYETWILLGEVNCMDEREEHGMRALTEGVKRAEQAGAAGAGMLSLAISYTNESLERASHTMLLRWLSSRFPDYKIPEETWTSLSNSIWHSNERVTEAFLDIARQQYSRGEMDPDVQIGLGVLFYTNSQYDRAKDCFQSALSVRPQDYILWNRLGSSLSNGNNPEEALGAYREALRLRPTYTRAIYNVGVACLNIGAHQEAAEHFLSALVMQDSSGGTKSDQLWFTLRRTFMAMNRLDLADKAKPETNIEYFRQEGFDF